MSNCTCGRGLILIHSTPSAPPHHQTILSSDLWNYYEKCWLKCPRPNDLILVSIFSSMICFAGRILFVTRWTSVSEVDLSFINVKRRCSQATLGLPSRSGSVYIAITIFFCKFLQFSPSWKYFEQLKTQNIEKMHFQFDIFQSFIKHGCISGLQADSALRMVQPLAQEVSVFCRTRQRYKSQVETECFLRKPWSRPIACIVGLHISNFNCLTECADKKILKQGSSLISFGAGFGGILWGKGSRFSENPDLGKLILCKLA